MLCFSIAAVDYKPLQKKQEEKYRFARFRIKQTVAHSAISLFGQLCVSHVERNHKMKINICVYQKTKYFIQLIYEIR